MSIKLRLFLLVGTGALAVLIISVVSYLGNARMASAMIDNEVSLTALGNHLQADMMHDALRADVLSAMLVGLGKSETTRGEVLDGLKEHAAQFRKALGDNLALPINATLKAELGKLKPSLDGYIDAGERIVGLALHLLGRLH
jgi:methyl-accepting chemotaxis protein